MQTLKTCNKCNAVIDMRKSKDRVITIEDRKPHYCRLYDYLISFKMDKRIGDIASPSKTLMVRDVYPYLDAKEINGIKKLIASQKQVKWKQWNQLEQLISRR